MNVALIWPFGDYRPGTVIDCDPTLGAVLVREGFARDPGPDPTPAEPKNPTVNELLTYAATHGISIDDAKKHFSADLAARAQGAPPS